MPDLAASPHGATLPNCDGCGQFTCTPTVVDNSWHGGAGMYMCGELLLCPRCAAAVIADKAFDAYSTADTDSPTAMPEWYEVEPGRRIRCKAWTDRAPLPGQQELL